MPEPKEHLDFSCCFCGKEMPTPKKIPVNFGIVCQDCSIELRALGRKVEAYRNWLFSNFFKLTADNGIHAAQKEFESVFGAKKQ